MVRIGAAIATLVLAVLLGFTIAASFGEPELIVPTGGVIHGGPQDALPGDRAAREALAARTRLQDYRGRSGPSPEGGAEAPIAGESLAIRGAEDLPWELVQQWRANEQNDWQVLRDRNHIAGIAPTVPDPRAPVLIQAQGRDWRRLHNEEITFGGGWVIFGFSLLLALFLLLRGRIPLKKGFSGQQVKRFDAFERANHWFTAGSFVMLALSGLVLIYGQFFVKPWLGAGAYSWLAQASIYTHVAFAVTFILGLLAMIVMWTGRNLPKKVDWVWLKRGGGFFSNRGENPPAEKFNAGQKLIYWAVVFGGLLLIVSGISLMFPFFWFGITAMQWALGFHAALGLIMIAIIIGHIYIGTVGMVGAIHAMWSGNVDRNWAEEHHNLWVEQEIDRDLPRHRPPSRRRMASPAE